MLSPSKVVVALSGGIDSALTAALLKEAGWQVHGLHFRLPGSEEQAEARILQTRWICEHLMIPLTVRDLRQPFHEAVIEPFIAAYLEGKTPNPCVICNELIKFPHLAAHADELGAACIATGHYARLFRPGDSLTQLRRGLDPRKEQSYFLHRLPAAILHRTLFPLGAMTKNMTRRQAGRLGLPLRPDSESQEICFLPGADYRELVRKASPMLPRKSSRIVDSEGHTLGTHAGAYRYTIGQRHGLGIASPRPYYVIEIRPERDEVVVGRREELYSTAVEADGFVWTGGPAAESVEGEVQAQIRYRHRAAPAWLHHREAGRVIVEFQEPQWAVTPGQALVCYRGDRVVGGGWIVKALPGGRKSP